MTYFVCGRKSEKPPRKLETAPIDRAEYVTWLKSQPSHYIAGEGGERLPKGKKFSDVSPIALYLDAKNGFRTHWASGCKRADWYFDGEILHYNLPQWAAELQSAAYAEHGELTCEWCLVALGETAHTDESDNACTCGTALVWSSTDAVEDDDGRPYGWYDIESCPTCHKEYRQKWVPYVEVAK